MSETSYSVGKMFPLVINTPQPLNITFTDGSQLSFPVSGKASFTGDVEESARVFFDAVIRRRDSQLEAERQRADDAVKEIQQGKEVGARAIKQLIIAGEEVFNLRAEIAALKSEQVPK